LGQYVDEQAGKARTIGRISGETAAYGDGESDLRESRLGH